MKAVLYKFLVVGYTLAVAAGAFSLLLISVQIDHFADTDTHEESSRMEKQTTKSANDSFKIASGPYYKKIEYNETFKMSDIFPIIKQAHSTLQVTNTEYDLTKIGTTPITVTFKNETGEETTRLLILEVVDTKGPVITAADQQLSVSEAFDALSGVSAQDEVDGDLTQKIKVTGAVNLLQEGEYHLQYQVSDNRNNTTKIDRKITVIPNETITTIEPVTTESVTAPKVEPINHPEEPAATQEPVNEPVMSPPTPPAAAAPAYQPNSLYIAGAQIPYQNGGQGAGQAIIDNNPYGTASTWGGAPIQAGNDGQNTHIIGHTPGLFSVLFSVGIGSTVVVTDSAGVPTTYVVNNILHLDDSGFELGTGADYWDVTVGTGGGERITLQTCISDTENLIVLASAA